MVAFHGFVDHGNGIIRIADHALAGGIQGQLLTAERVSSGSCAVRLEVGCGADVCPFDITAQTERVKQILMCSCKGLKSIREIGAVCYGERMLRVDEQASGSADDQQYALYCGIVTASIPMPYLAEPLDSLREVWYNKDVGYQKKRM